MSEESGAESGAPLGGGLSELCEDAVATDHGGFDGFSLREPDQRDDARYGETR